MPLNSAFVFVKPHAVTDATKVLVKEGLIASGLTILSEGTITAEEIDEKKLIDQHYYAIASKATILKPNQLNVPSAKFEAQFGLTWEAALAQGNVYNAMDACALLGVTADEMDSQWGICKKAKKLVKFGGGFYCGLIEIEGKPSVYVFNGFFMSMRSKFTAPGESIYYYTVEWDSAALSWADFRGQVLGPTDPAEAPATSLRGKIAAQWKALGLAAEPNVGDNGVHASASPFEALAERLNWCGATLEKDSFGTALLGAGVPKSMINSWCVDPQVALADAEGKGSLFDALEDMNANDCILKCRALAVKNVETLYLQDGPEAASLSDYLPFFPFKKIDRFYDISGFLKAPEVFQKIVDIFVERYSILDVDAIGGIDARGFVLGPPIALALKKPFFMLRKPGKMPNCVFSEPYKVEYGTREGLGIQKDAVAKGDRVLLIDDLVATGGTLSAAIECVQMCGGSVVECACIVELKFFREQRMKFYSDLGIADVPVWGLVSEDVLQTAKTVGSDYKDDGEEH
jgi:adenine phosphoribosyltransferase